MIGFYTPLLILQAFCLYHAYKNNVEQRWYWFIIILPGLGCLIYMYHNFYNRNNINTIAEGVKEVVNSNYKIEQLEKALQFSDNITNKTNLADAYVGNNRYTDAIVLYKECLTGFMSDDPALRIKLLHASYLNKDYNSVIQYGEALESEKRFVEAEEKAGYAWSQYHTGNTAKAESLFESMDKSFKNYKQRAEFCKFLIAINKPDVLKVKLAELNEELEHMKGPERKFFRQDIKEIRELHASYIRN
jgi:hypothetical protein